MKTKSPLHVMLVMFVLPLMVLTISFQDIIEFLIKLYRQLNSPIVNQVESETKQTLEEVEEMAKTVGAPEVVQDVIDVAKEVTDVLGAVQDLFKPKVMEMQPVFVHGQHGAFYGTSLELRHQYALHRGNMSEMMNGKRNQVGGWSIK